MDSTGEEIEWQRWQREYLEQGIKSADAKIRQQEQAIQIRRESDNKLMQERAQIQQRITEINAVLANNGQQTDHLAPVLKRQREDLDAARDSPDERVKRRFLLNFEPSAWPSEGQCLSPSPEDTVSTPDVVARDEGEMQSPATGIRARSVFNCLLCRQVVS